MLHKMCEKTLGVKISLNKIYVKIPLLVKRMYEIFHRTKRNKLIELISIIKY